MSAKKMIFSFVLALALFLPAMFLLSACGESGLKDNEITITVTDKAYDGNAISVTTSSTSGETPILAFKLASAQDVESSYSQTAPKNAGTYTVRAILLETDTFKGATKTANFTISQRELVIYWSGMTADELVYSGLAKVPQVGASNLVSGDDCLITTSVSEGMDNINVGTFTMVATSVSNPNYKLPDFVDTRTSSDYTITKAPAQTFIAPENIQATFGQTLADVELPAGFSWQNSLTDVGSVGTHEFDATFAQSSNYEKSTGKITVVVGKADPKIILENLESLQRTYDGQVVFPTITQSGEGQLSYDFKIQGAEDSTYDGHAPSNAGRYVLRIRAEETENFLPSTKTFEFEIAKANPEYSVPTTLSATFGQTLGDIDLNDAVNFSFEDDLQTSVGNAGQNVFKMTFTPQDTQNFNIINGIDVTISVVKANQTIQITVSDRNYTGSPTQAPQVTVSTGQEFELFYKLKAASDESFTQTVPTNAGAYTVKAVVAESENYNMAVSTKDFNISKVLESSFYGNEVFMLRHKKLGADSWQSSNYYKAGDVVVLGVDITYQDTAYLPTGIVSFEFTQGTLNEDFLFDGQTNQLTFLKATTIQVHGLIAESQNFLSDETSGYQNLVAEKATQTIVLTNLDEISKTYDAQPCGTPNWTKQFDDTTTSYFDAHYYYKLTSESDDNYVESIGGNKNPVNAGVYNVKVFLPASDVCLSASVVGEFEISKAQQTVSIASDISKSFDGQPATSPNYSLGVFDGLLENSDIVVEYKGLQDGAYSTTAPSAVGSYVVKVTINETQNCLGCFDEQEFEIVSILIEDISKDYDGEPVSAEGRYTTALVGDATITYYNSNDLETAIDAPTNAGNYVVKVEISGESATCEFEIRKIDLTQEEIDEIQENLPQLSANYGQTLGDINLSSYTGWAFFDAQDTPVGDVNYFNEFAMLYTKDSNHTAQKFYVQITVNPIDPTVPTNVEFSWGEMLYNQYVLPDGWRVADEYEDNVYEASQIGSTDQIKIVFDDYTGNYNAIKDQTIEITIVKAKIFADFYVSLDKQNFVKILSYDNQIQALFTGEEIGFLLSLYANIDGDMYEGDLEDMFEISLSFFAENDVEMTSPLSAEPTAVGNYKIKAVVTPKTIYQNLFDETILISNYTITKGSNVTSWTDVSNEKVYVLNFIDTSLLDSVVEQKIINAVCGVCYVYDLPENFSGSDEEIELLLQTNASNIFAWQAKVNYDGEPILEGIEIFTFIEGLLIDKKVLVNQNDGILAEETYGQVEYVANLEINAVGEKGISTYNITLSFNTDGAMQNAFVMFGTFDKTSIVGQPAQEMFGHGTWSIQDGILTYVPDDSYSLGLNNTQTFVFDQNGNLKLNYGTLEYVYRVTQAGQSMTFGFFSNGNQKVLMTFFGDISTQKISSNTVLGVNFGNWFFDSERNLVGIRSAETGGRTFYFAETDDGVLEMYNGKVEYYFNAEDYSVVLVDYAGQNFAITLDEVFDEQKTKFSITDAHDLTTWNLFTSNGKKFVITTALEMGVMFDVTENSKELSLKSTSNLFGYIYQREYNEVTQEFENVTYSVVFNWTNNDGELLNQVSYIKGIYTSQELLNKDNPLDLITLECVVWQFMVYDENAFLVLMQVSQSEYFGFEVQPYMEGPFMTSIFEFDITTGNFEGFFGDEIFLYNFTEDEQDYTEVFVDFLNTYRFSYIYEGKITSLQEITNWPIWFKASSWRVTNGMILSDGYYYTVNPDGITLSKYYGDVKYIYTFETSENEFNTAVFSTFGNENILFMFEGKITSKDQISQLSMRFIEYLSWGYDELSGYVLVINTYHNVITGYYTVNTDQFTLSFSLGEVKYLYNFVEDHDGQDVDHTFIFTKYGDFSVVFVTENNITTKDAVTLDLELAMIETSWVEENGYVYFDGNIYVVGQDGVTLSLYEQE